MIALGLSEVIDQIRIPYGSHFSNSAQYIFATFFNFLKTLIAITICHYIGFLPNFVHLSIIAISTRLVSSNLTNSLPYYVSTIKYFLLTTKQYKN